MIFANLAILSQSIYFIYFYFYNLLVNLNLPDFLIRITIRTWDTARLRDLIPFYIASSVVVLFAVDERETKKNVGKVRKWD